jgi:hypothetical protein
VTLPGLELTEGSARFSDCGRYRYELTRRWSDGPLALWIMLNPSTADAEQDDPTIRRCIGFSRREGCGGLVVVNLFAYRATRPDRLLTVADPIGWPENTFTIRRWIEADEVGLRVAGWGAWWHAQRVRPARLHVEGWAREAGRELGCLGRTVDGSPRHPLYVKGDTPIEVYA